MHNSRSKKSINFRYNFYVEVFLVFIMRDIKQKSGMRLFDCSSVQVAELIYL